MDLHALRGNDRRLKPSAERKVALTSRQIDLARHALGLTREETRRSYRNHFVAGPNHGDYEEWMKMAAAGMAFRRQVGGFGGDDLFHLTRPGAEAALRAGDSLDSEDFPRI